MAPSSAFVFFLIQVFCGTSRTAQSVSYADLPNDTITSNGSSGCHRVSGIPYCGQHVNYMLNTSLFGSKAQVQAASNRSFNNYLSTLQQVQPLFSDERFDADGWQFRCQSYIGYYHCLSEFPACVESAGQQHTVPHINVVFVVLRFTDKKSLIIGRHVQIRMWRL